MPDSQQGITLFEAGTHKWTPPLPKGRKERLKESCARIRALIGRPEITAILGK